VDVYHQIGGFFAADAFANALFENPGFGRHWLTVELRGTRSNRFGVGARIRAEFKDGTRVRSVYRVVGSAGSFGARPLREEIGVAGATSLETLEVVWPATGRTQRFTDLPTDRFVRITEGSDTIQTLTRRSFRFGEQRQPTALPH
jgi:hypothetical protein